MATYQQRRKAAKKTLKASGITLKRLAKTTGTTKGEVRQVFNQTAKRMAKGGATTKDMAAMRRALSGGPMAGVPSQPKKAANVTRRALQNYHQTLHPNQGGRAPSSHTSTSSVKKFKV